MRNNKKPSLTNIPVELYFELQLNTPIERVDGNVRGKTRYWAHGDVRDDGLVYDGCLGNGWVSAERFIEIYRQHKLRYTKALIRLYRPTRKQLELNNEYRPKFAPSISDFLINHVDKKMWEQNL